ncbi:MAG TPA: hypothetical protein VGW38_01695 [Chloroflexota bacterium]|nr:hypothetical protein [Chloroflexota bacterium]
MMDQLMSETIITLHPDTRFSSQATAALQRLMAHYAASHPVSYWAILVSSSSWRIQRHEIIRAVAEKDWIKETDTVSALQFAELAVMAVEAVAAQWRPEQCRLSAVRINGKMVMSLISSVEGCAA